MAGFCGWVDTTAHQYSEEKTLQEMSKFLPPMGDEYFTNVNNLIAICLKSSTNEMSVYSDNGFIICIDGSPYFSNKVTVNNSNSSSCAEHILKLYKKFDTNFLEYVHGSFAIFLYDKNKKRTILAIDRIGTRPLCYSSLKTKGLVFGATTDSVIRHPKVENNINYQALYDYIYFHMVPSPYSIYKNVNKLEPAQYLIYENGRLSIERYWEPYFVETNIYSPNDLKEELKNVLSTTIERYGSEENTGAFLSGGIDSSTVSGYLANIKNTSTNVYSIGFSEKGYDEIKYARIAAQHFGNKLIEYYVTPDDVITALPKIANAYDEPFGNSSAVPAFFCAQLASQNGTKIMLAGDGGDELFAGNERYATQKLFDLYNNLPVILRENLLEPIFLGSSFSNKFIATRKIHRYIEQARVSMPERMETYNFLYRTNPELIFNNDFINAIDISHPIKHLSDVYSRSPGKSLLNHMLYLDWKITLADNDLRKVNRMCEISGIKVYYPLLDDEIINFSTKVHPSLKLKGLKLRYFFKWALNDFLPKNIITKQKHGFGLPFGHWLKTSKNMQELIYDNLYSLKKRSIINPIFIDNLIMEHRNGHAAYYGTMIWVLSMLEQWFKEHDVSV